MALTGPSVRRRLSAGGDRGMLGAFADLGIEHVDVPATPGKRRRAIRDA